MRHLYRAVRFLFLTVTFSGPLIMLCMAGSCKQTSKIGNFQLSPVVSTSFVAHVRRDLSTLQTLFVPVPTKLSFYLTNDFRFTWPSACTSNSAIKTPSNFYSTRSTSLPLKTTAKYCKIASSSIKRLSTSLLFIIIYRINFLQGCRNPRQHP